MRQKPDDAERMAMQRELREGRDPFNASFEGALHFTAPHPRCSLWDMVANFSLHGTVWLFDQLSVLIQQAEHNKQLAAKYGNHEILATPKGREALRQACEVIKSIDGFAQNIMGLMKSGHVQNALDRLNSWSSHGKHRWEDCFTRACALRDAIRIECVEYLFYAYPKDKGQKFNAWQEDWGRVHVAFPEVSIDTFCATDCYALGHNTASVFHSMRVAEAGLRALAKERRVKLPKKKLVDWATWGEIINALEGKAKLVRQSKAGPRKDAELEFYSGVLADLNGFKDEYRNLVTHSREHYDEFQAARALSRVHDFMVRLAEIALIKRRGTGDCRP